MATHFTPLTSEIYLNLIERGYTHMYILGPVPNKYLDLPEDYEVTNVIVQPGKGEANSDKVRCVGIESKLFVDFFEDKEHSLWVSNGYVRKKKIDFSLSTKSKLFKS